VSRPAVPTREELTEAALVYALAEVGQREASTNWSPRIAEYLKSVGITFPAPWCAAFTFFCTHRALTAHGLPVPVVRSGYCPTIRQWAEDAEVLHSVPQEGDYFLYHSGGRARHIGFVTSVDNNRFGTVEGNTNLGGSPEGVGVFRRTRPRADRYRFVRWVDALNLPESRGSVALYVSGSHWADIPLIAGRALVPVRWWGEKMKFRVDWDAAAQGVEFNGRPLETELTLIEGDAFAPIRDVARFSGLKVDYQPGRVDVRRGTG
jgi:hypothetical protein